MKHIDIARLGERAVLDKYVEKGFDVVETNWRFGIAGEVDVIVKKDSVLVFCEVKARTSHRVGISENINERKVERLRTLATSWCEIDHSKDGISEIRLDVASVQIEDGKVKEINILEDIN